MITLTLKRRGYTDTVITNIDNYYLEYHHLTGSIILKRLYTKVKVWRDKEYPESYEEILYNGYTEYKGEEPLQAVTELKKLIKLYFNIDAKFNNYVEAYEIAENTYNKLYPYLNHDKKFYNGLCVEGLKVAEVMQRLKDFEQLKCFKIDKIINIIKDNFHKVNNMLFTDFYKLIKDINYKSNYEELFIKGIM